MGNWCALESPRPRPSHNRLLKQKLNPPGPPSVPSRIHRFNGQQLPGPRQYAPMANHPWHQWLPPPASYQKQYLEQQNKQQTFFFLSPTICRPVNQLTEEEQINIAKRLGFITQLPVGYYYDGCTEDRECVICMVAFSVNEQIRSLPCMHIYHTKCIDDWLMRSFTCPICMEPVDTGLDSAMKIT